MLVWATKVLSFRYGSHLSHGSCEDNNLVKLAHTLHELIYAGSFDDVDIVELAFDFYRYSKICLMKDLKRSVSRKAPFDTITYLKTAMDQSLIKVKDKAFFSPEPISHRRQQPLLLFSCSCAIGSLSLSRDWTVWCWYRRWRR